jgi:cell division protein FtsI/penicillin-binding protein 2
MESYEISTTTKTSFPGKSNSELSQEERDAKRIFKKKVKLQSRLKIMNVQIGWSGWARRLVWT